MKHTNRIWMLGYVASALILCMVFMIHVPEYIKAGGAMLAASLFSITHVHLLHEKMMKDDQDYRIAVNDERNITIKEKAGNITNIVNIVFLGIITIACMVMNDLIPAMMVGCLLFLNPFIIIIISHKLEKKI